MSRWVVRMCAAVGWLDIVDRDVIDAYLASPASVAEREPNGNGQGRLDVPGIPPWVWATTGLCVVVSVLLVVPPRVLLEPASSSVSAPKSVSALQPLPEIEPRVGIPVVAPASPLPNIEPSPSPSRAPGDLYLLDTPGPSAAPRPEHVSHPRPPPSRAAIARDRAQQDLHAALERLGQVTRVEWVSGSATEESGPVGVAAAVRIGDRIQSVWIELELGPDSGATLRIQEPSAKPETIGKWASLAKAGSGLGDSLIRWYRRHEAKSREAAEKLSNVPADPYEIPGYGGRK